MSIPSDDYQAQRVTHRITPNSVQGYQIAFMVDFHGLDPAFHAEIAQIVEDAADDIKAAVEAAHPTWTVIGERVYDGHHSTPI